MTTVSRDTPSTRDHQLDRRGVMRRTTAIVSKLAYNSHAQSIVGNNRDLVNGGRLRTMHDGHVDVLPARLRMQHAIAIHPAAADILHRVESHPQVDFVDQIKVAQVREEGRAASVRRSSYRLGKVVYALRDLDPPGTRLSFVIGHLFVSGLLLGLQRPQLSGQFVQIGNYRLRKLVAEFLHQLAAQSFHIADLGLAESRAEDFTALSRIKGCCRFAKSAAAPAKACVSVRS